jgi:hypothetical protein
MSNMDRFRTTPGSTDCEFNKIMDELRLILRDGIEHGFFHAEISVSIPRADRREVVISAGKSHKYTIRTDELPR